MSEAKQISFFDPPEKEQRLTQCMKIVKYMNDFGSITPVQAMRGKSASQIRIWA